MSLVAQLLLGLAVTGAGALGVVSAVRLKRRARVSTRLTRLLAFATETITGIYALVTGDIVVRVAGGVMVLAGVAFLVKESVSIHATRRASD